MQPLDIIKVLDKLTEAWQICLEGENKDHEEDYWRDHVASQLRTMLLVPMRYARKHACQARYHEAGLRALEEAAKEESLGSRDSSIPDDRPIRPQEPVR